MKFQQLQQELSKFINEDEVCNIAIGIANSNLTSEQKCEVLENILKVYTK